MATAQLYSLIAAAAFWEILLFIAGLTALVAYQLLTRRINTQNLFCGVRRDGRKYFSPERVQLLIFTVAAAFQYLRSVMLVRHTGQFPPVPKGMLELVGSSNVLYLAGKSLMTLKIPGLNSSAGAKGS
ncbi:MAG: hypothetical protein JO340_14925 [Acidobacteriaceae bacterium]|nr:hypothetical protein [Acidobacteriaceae bacterium]